MFKQISLSLLATGTVAVLALSGCSNPDVTMAELKGNADYWQRANVTDATYAEGPKLQQTLHRDISRCVVELRETDRLGVTRNATPALNGNDPNTPSGKIAEWETPERNGYLRAEHSDYHDFETCMQAKGWERTEYLPANAADKSRKNYMKTMYGEKYRSQTGEDYGLGNDFQSPYDENAGRTYKDLNQ